MDTGIYLIVQFNWPQPLKPEYGKLARKLHDITQDKTWIQETLAASGGIGGGPSSIWVFWLEDYAGLERLLRDKEDEIAVTFQKFFAEMVDVKDFIREQVRYL